MSKKKEVRRRATKAEANERAKIVQRIKSFFPDNGYVSIKALAAPHIPKEYRASGKSLVEFQVKIDRTWRNLSTDPEAVAVLKSVLRSLDR